MSEKRPNHLKKLKEMVKDFDETILKGTMRKNDNCPAVDWFLNTKEVDAIRFAISELESK